MLSDDTGQVCSAADCLAPAEAVSTLTVFPTVSNEPLTLSLPLCGEHRDVLRYGITGGTTDV